MSWFQSREQKQMEAQQRQLDSRQRDNDRFVAESKDKMSQGGRKYMSGAAQALTGKITRNPVDIVIGVKRHLEGALELAEGTAGYLVGREANNEINRQRQEVQARGTQKRR